jgi:hypothetical protein
VFVAAQLTGVKSRHEFSAVLPASQVERFGRGKRFVAALCLFLTFVAALGEASHVHFKARPADSPIRCSLCVAAHSAKPAPICQPMRSSRVFTAIAIQQNPIAGSRLDTSDLFVRPPPSAS